MKKLVFSLAIFASLLTSCISDDEETTTTKTPVVGEILADATTREINTSVVYPFGNYTLRGMVKIKSGVTVTFEAGSTITCNKTNGENGIVVLKGGKLIMNGTAAEPIVLTEVSKVPGSWAGIIIYGEAPIVNSPTAPTPQTAISEDGLSMSYGGSIATDNSGTLRYVRVEYAGQVITQNNKEHNGFSFYSVGSGTILENLVSFMGNDDGFEFYGGTVSMRNAISYGNTDDAFDWQDGWRGQDNSNWFAYQVTKANYGFEVEAKSVNNSFSPKIVNITLKRVTGTLTESLSEIQLDAIQFKKEGNGDFSNIVIDGYKNYTSPAVNGGAIQILDLNTNNNQVAGGKIKLTNVKIINCDNNFISGASTFTTTANTFNPLTNWNPTTTATGASLSTGNWANAYGINLLQNL